MGDVLGSAAGFAYQQWLRRQVRAGEDTPQFPQTLNEVASYQESVRQLIAKAAGPTPEYDPLDAEIHQVHQRDGYRIEAVSFSTFGGLRMTANAYVPDVDHPVPGILATHGHSKHGRRDPKVQQRCAVWAKSGYFVLAIDAIGNGERAVELPGSYHGGNLAGALWTVGYSLFGIQIHENFRACDYLSSRPEVDESKLAISGSSGGGNQSFYSGAWDDRFAAVIPVVSAGSYNKLVASFNCMCETPWGLAGALEQYDIMAAMAPRAVLVINAKLDNVTFRFEDAQRTVEKASEVWDLMGASDAVSFHAMDAKHSYPRSGRELALGWFNKWLKGAQDASPVQESDVRVEDYATLSCYPTAETSRVLTLPQLFANKQTKVVDPFDAGDESQSHDTVQRLRDEFGKPGKVNLTLEPVNLLRSTTPQSAGVSYLFKSDDGLLITAHTNWPDWSHTARRALVMVGDDKKELSTSPLAREALEQGMVVWAVDLPGLGEARLPGEVSEYAANLLRIKGCISASRASHMLGFHLAGHWLSVIQAIGETLSDDMDSITLATSGGPSTAVLAGASLLTGFDRLIVRNPLASYQLADTFEEIPFESLIPNILPIGDIPYLASLAAPTPMTVVAPIGADGNELPVENVETVFSPVIQRYEKLGQRAALHLMGKAEAETALFFSLV